MAQVKPDFVNIVSEYFLTNSIAFGQYYKDPEFVFQGIFGQTSVFKSNHDLIELYSKVHQTGILSENGEKFWFKFVNENNFFFSYMLVINSLAKLVIIKEITLLRLYVFMLNLNFVARGLVLLFYINY